MRILIFTILLAGNILGQGVYKFDTLSPKFDVQLRVVKLENGVLRGKTKISIFGKGSQKPLQTFYLKDTRISLDKDGNPEIATIQDKREGKWSTIYLEDINFDGFEDLAVVDGNNGGYWATSYSIYLYDPAKRKFAYNREFTRLAHGPFMGIPVVDPKRKTLEVFWKSGVGFHETQRYKILGNRPVKVYQCSESTALNDGNRYITTKKLIKGKWRTWEKTVTEPL